MKEFKVKVAEKVIKISCNYNFSYDYCKEYTTDEIEDFSIEIEPKDIEFERERATIKCSNGYLELLAIHRKISEIMPKYNTILFHGSVLAIDGKGYLFTAPSGTGKSTHTILWKESILLYTKHLNLNMQSYIIFSLFHLIYHPFNCYKFFHSDASFLFCFIFLIYKIN